MSVQLSIFNRLAYVLFSSELLVLTLSQLSQALEQSQKVRIDHRKLERLESTVLTVRLWLIHKGANCLGPTLV